ncbi:hypothetical protein NESM_000177900 [Novymonas esmeraldas]|uniref:Uncharacterized protein n=1 Tax=Novymonas esmeraldas TaxID=1808958 RepID=A0AAW0F3K4_9TRYP
MTDNISKHRVVRDYYREAQQAASLPMTCPYCKRPGRFAASTYEIAKRIPAVMAEGIARCHSCQTSMGRSSDAALQLRMWYCGYCEVCMCHSCQKTSTRSR